MIVDVNDNVTDTATHSHCRVTVIIDVSDNVTDMATF